MAVLQRHHGDGNGGLGKKVSKSRYDLRVENHVPHGSFSASKTIDDENCKRIVGG